MGDGITMARVNPEASPHAEGGLETVIRCQVLPWEMHSREQALNSHFPPKLQANKTDVLSVT